MELRTRRNRWWLLASLAGGAAVSAIVLAVVFGVVVSASGGNAFDVGFAAVGWLVLGLPLGAILGGLAFIIRYRSSVSSRAVAEAAAKEIGRVSGVERSS